MLCPGLSPAFAHEMIRQFPSGFAAEDGEARKAEPDSAALIDVANSFGVKYPRLLCGRSSLYSIFRDDLTLPIEQVLKPDTTNILPAAVRGSSPRVRSAALPA